MKSIAAFLGSLLCLSLCSPLVAQDKPEKKKSYKIRYGATATIPGAQKVYFPETTTTKEGEQIATKWHEVSLNTYTSTDTVEYKGSSILQFYVAKDLKSKMVGTSKLPSNAKSVFLLFINSKTDYSIPAFPFNEKYGQHTVVNYSKAELGVTYDGKKQLVKPGQKVELKPTKRVTDINIQAKVNNRVRILASTKWAIEPAQHEFIVVHSTRQGKSVKSKHIMIYKVEKEKKP